MAIASTDSTYIFTVTGNRSLTAVFEKIVPTYTITVTVTPEGSGTVTGTGQYQEGETVTIKAVPEDGYEFTAWNENGQIVSGDAEYTFTVSVDRALVAVFEAVKASRLPEGYTEIEYIQSGSGQYIKTGVYATAADLQKIVMDVEPTDASGCFFGVYQSGNGTSYYYYFQASQTKGEGTVTFYIQKTKEAVNFDASNQRVTVSFDRGKRVGSVNDLTTNVFPTSMVASGELVLLARNYISSSGSSIGAKLPAKLYACQMYKDAETLVRDFVPCINPGGIAGLYDLVEGAFYKSPISTNFTAGPAV